MCPIPESNKFFFVVQINSLLNLSDVLARAGVTEGDIILSPSIKSAIVSRLWQMVAAWALIVLPVD